MAGSIAASISMRCLCFFSMADISLNYGEKKTFLEIEAKKGHRVEQGKKQPRIPTADNEL
jgi:hypothetical protein